MRMPPGDNGSNQEQNYIGNFEETPYFFEQVEVSDTGVPISPADDANSTVAEADFSEYMWMEHMEEFDREVMKKLEEEALMEECLSFNAMLEDEKTEPSTSAEKPASEQPPSEPTPRQAPDVGATAKLLQEMRVEQAGPSTSAAIGGGFKLNPEAAEFIPASKVGKKGESKKDT